MAPTLGEAAAALRKGGLVVFPTDTLYGLAADPRNPGAVARLLEAKGRPGGMPVAVAVSSLEEVEPLAVLDAGSRRFLRRHLPGPITVLLRPSRASLRGLSGPIARASGRIGVRIPDHPVARTLARLAGPVTCTSANVHGQPPARSLADARRTFGPRVAVYLDGGPRPRGRPSGIVDLTTDPPTVRARV